MQTSGVLIMHRKVVGLESVHMGQLSSTLVPVVWGQVFVQAEKSWMLCPCVPSRMQIR